MTPYALLGNAFAPEFLELSKNGRIVLGAAVDLVVLTETAAPRKPS